MNKITLTLSLLAVPGMALPISERTLNTLPWVTGLVSAQILATEWSNGPICAAMLGAPLIAGIVANKSPQGKKAVNAALVQDWKVSAYYLTALAIAGVTKNWTTDIAIKTLGTGISWAVFNLFA